MSTKHEELTQRWSTWGDKLLQHTDRLYDIQAHRTFRPITIQLAPTEVCDSDCPFCSVGGRPLKSRMPWDTVVQVLTDFRYLGAKAVEVTGGGNPMLYSDRGHDINDLVTLAHGLGYDVGIITNSHSLKRLKPEVHGLIDWVRISLIQLDEGKEPEDYDLAGFPAAQVGFSYIIYETDGFPDLMSRTGRIYPSTTPDTIRRIARMVELHPLVKFVRLAGDCLVQGDNKRIAAKWKPVVDEIDRWGKFFLKDIQDQDVPFDDRCYVGMLRPYVASGRDGQGYFVYTCSSFVLETRTYDPAYALCPVEKILSAWARMNENFSARGYPYQVKGNGGRNWCGTCKHCFYQNNNRLLHTVASELPDRNFA